MRSRSRYLPGPGRPFGHRLRGAPGQRWDGLGDHPRLPGSPSRRRTRSRPGPPVGGRLPLWSGCGHDRQPGSLRDEGFVAIVIAVGARRGRPLGIEGEDADGVLDGLDFLRAARTGDAPPLGRRSASLAAAMSPWTAPARHAVCRTEKWLVFYRRTRSEMPAQDEELSDLLDEGGHLVELAAPRSLVAAGGRLQRVGMSKMRLSEADASGRKRPEVVPGADFEVEIDTLIVAIGQLPDLSVFGGEDVALDSAGYVEVIARPWRRPWKAFLPVATSSAAGRPTSSSRRRRQDDRRGDPRSRCCRNPNNLAPGRELAGVQHHRSPAARARTEPRVAYHRPATDRRGFDEVVLTLTPGAAAEEAARCLDCDVMCSTCDGGAPTGQSSPIPLRPVPSSYLPLTNGRAVRRSRAQSVTGWPRARRSRCSPTPATSAETASPSAPPPDGRGATNRGSTSTVVTSRPRTITPSCCCSTTAREESRHDSAAISTSCSAGATDYGTRRLTWQWENSTPIRWTCIPRAFLSLTPGQMASIPPISGP